MKPRGTVILTFVNWVYKGLTGIFFYEDTYEEIKLALKNNLLNSGSDIFQAN